MACTTRLVDTINWAKAFVGFADLAIGKNAEPALSIANIVLQTITGPPFLWAWNRNKQQFFLTPGTQDYLQTFSDWGFLEVLSVQAGFAVLQSSSTGSGVATYLVDVPNYPTPSVNPFVVGQFVTVTGSKNTPALNVLNVPVIAIGTVVTTPADTVYSFSVQQTGLNAPGFSEVPTCVATIFGNKAYPCEVKYEAITEATEQGRPMIVGQHLSDSGDSGSIVFRFLSVPDVTYSAVVTYQKSLPTFSSVASLWNIPDYLEYVFNYGFLGLVLDYFDDPRAAHYHQMFIATLLGRAEGLSSMDKNMFLGNWLALQNQFAGAAAKTQQGIQARGT